jgi:phosphate-selective porin OprO/OprP
VKRLTLRVGLGVAALCLLSVARAHASEKSVAEEILDILRAQGSITDAQYEDLRERARAETASAESSEPWDVYWNNGLRFESPDEQFEIKMGGRLMMDWARIDADDDVATFFNEPDLDGGTGTEFRRARLYVSGTLYERIGFKAQYDFAGSDADLKDAYMELLEIPWVGKFRVGHFKEPFSLEELTSSKYITFLERSLPTEAFAPSRNSGFYVQNAPLDKRLTWALGYFRETDDSGFDFGKDDIWNLSGRVTGLPWYEDEGSRLLHLGFSYSHSFSDGDVRFRSRPEAHLSPVRFVDTGSFAADAVDLINPEIALVFGPLSLQGEYYRAFVDSSVQDDPELDGFYVEASYFLTGEHRAYKRSAAAFDRVRPADNFDASGGWGAWQIAARYSQVDLADGNLSTIYDADLTPDPDDVNLARELDNIAVGLNWYLNPNVRVMLNYVYSDLEDLDSTDIFQTRFQIDF